jgi:tetratricopeptide (TPR) repeat protein
VTATKQTKDIVNGTTNPMPSPVRCQVNLAGRCAFAQSCRQKCTIVELNGEEDAAVRKTFRKRFNPYSSALKDCTSLSSLLSLSVVLFLTSPTPAFAVEDFYSATQAGVAAMDAGKFDDAEKQFQKALLLSGSGPKYGDYSTGLINLGDLNARRKQPSQAENYYREALRNYQKAFGETCLECATVNESLGDMYRKSGKFASAIPFLEKAKFIREQKAKDHPDLANTLASLAECKSKTGKKEEAVSLMQKAVAIREKAYGRLHGKVIKSRYVLARLYDELGKTDMAIASFEKLVEDSGNDEQAACPAMERLAVLYSAIDKPAKAEKMFKRVLPLREQRPGKNSADLKNCVKLYCEFLQKQNRVAESKQLETRLVSRKVSR